MESRSNANQIKLLLALLVIVPVGLLAMRSWSLGDGRAQADGAYFPETGHNVVSPFYEYFQTHGGVQLFGYPITEAFTDEQTGLLVQVFQRARMEYSPDNPAAGVRLGNLAEEMGYGRPALTPGEIQPDSPNYHFFRVTGHSTQYSFLTYFNTHGGAEIFGYPISEPFTENGRLVQYFQRARMEWWPERPPNERVDLTMLGLIYAEQRLPAPAVARVGPVSGMAAGPTPTPPITELNVTAAVKDPTARQNGTQTVYVMVTDQSGTPVKGASTHITVNFNVSPHTYTGPQTSEHGMALLTFPLEPDRAGKVITVEVLVSDPSGRLSAKTETSYMVWP